MACEPWDTWPRSGNVRRGQQNLPALTECWRRRGPRDGHETEIQPGLSGCRRLESIGEASQTDGLFPTGVAAGRLVAGTKSGESNHLIRSGPVSGSLESTNRACDDVRKRGNHESDTDRGKTGKSAKGKRRGQVPVQLLVPVGNGSEMFCCSPHDRRT